MKITAGLGSVDDYPMYVEAGADECLWSAKSIKQTRSARL